MARYTIVGAGLAGLTLASELSKYDVKYRLIESRDYAGGIHILDEGLMNDITKMVNNVNVQFKSTLLSINNRSIIVSEGGVEDVINDVIIIATGFRVMTPMELNIYGDRPAGVYTFHAVIDLLRYGLLPGHDVVVYGDNNYALSLTKELIKRGVNAFMISPRTMEGITQEIIKIGYVKYIKGSSRVEKILVNNEWVKADTLVISMFKPYNPIPSYPAIGQAAINTYEPGIVKKTAEIMANELLSTDTDYITIVSDVLVFPGLKVHRNTRKVIIDYRGRLLINDKEIVLNKPSIVELPDVDKVVIRRVV